MFRSLDGYRWAWLPRDVVAGLLIVSIAIPLSMGMAEVAGMPPIAGLYSCVLPLVAYAVFGSSRQLVIALDASTAAMVAAALAPMAGSDPVRYAALAGLIAVLVGVILIVAGWMRLGFVADVLSRPVLLGYQAGLAIVVIVSQLPRLLGVAIEEDTTLPRALETMSRLDDANLPTVAVGVVSLAMIVAAAARRRSVSAAVFVIIGSTLAVAFFGSLLADVEVLGKLPAGLPALGLPAFGASDVMQLFAVSVAIAVLAAADTIVSSRAFARRNGYDVDANRDLIGLGAANLSSGLSGGITTSASAARTAVVEMVGGRSQLASVSAAAVMVAVLLFLTRPLELVPTAALAAVVIGAVLRLIEGRALQALWRIRRSELVIALATAAGAVVVGLLEGIAIGVGASLLDVAARRVRRRHWSMPVLSATRQTKDIGVYRYRFIGPLSFLDTRRFRHAARAILAATPGHDRLIVDGSGITDVDATAADMLADLAREFEGRGAELILEDMRPNVRAVLSRMDVLERLQPAVPEVPRQPATPASRQAA